jgi:hypothetical protein
VARSSLVRSALCTLALLSPVAAHAEVYDAPNGSQPIPYTARGLTLPALTLAPQVSGTLDKLSLTTAKATLTQVPSDPKTLNVALAVGASMGILANIEVGAVVVPLQVLPDVAYGDPSVHGTFRFVRGAFELAGYINTTFITHQGVVSDVTLPVLNQSAGVVFNPGLLSRIHMGGRAKLDIGATVPIQLGSAVHDIGLNIPVELAFNLADFFYLGADTGFGIANVKSPAINSYVPLGLLAGFTISGDDKPVVDIGALFRWPQFANPGKDQTIDTADFQAGVSAAAYIYFM